MDSSSIEDFDLFEAIFEAPDLLDLVVQQCRGSKNNLRLACSRLRSAVDACVTELAWTGFNPLVNEVEHMAVLARCPRLQTLEFNGHNVADLSPFASRIGLRKVTGLRASWTRLGRNLAPFAALTQLEHLECSRSTGISDISALRVYGAQIPGLQLHQDPAAAAPACKPRDADLPQHAPVRRLNSYYLHGTEAPGLPWLRHNEHSASASQPGDPHNQQNPRSPVR